MSKKYQTDKVVKLQGKEYILFEGLLEIAHAEWDLAGIETNMVQFPSEANEREAIVHAVVRTKDGMTFSGYGDASVKNVGKMIVPHIIRMAETRAIGRALRFLTGFGTVFEELGEVDFSKESKPEQPKKEEKKESTIVLASKAQLNKIEKDAKALGLSVEQVYSHLSIDKDQVGKTDASNVIKFLKTDEAKALAPKETEESGLQTDKTPF